MRYITRCFKDDGEGGGGIETKTINTTADALSKLFFMLGGDIEDADFSLNTEALKAIYERLGGEAADVADLSDIPSIVDKIADAVNDAGGGGSSDFSTATITVINNSKDFNSISGAFLISGDDEHGVPPMSYSVFNIQSSDTSVDANVIMYKGTAFIQMDQAGKMVIDGKITMRGNGFVVTGDGTITIPA